MSAFAEDDARLAAMHGYEPVRHDQDCHCAACCALCSGRMTADALWARLMANGE